MPHRSDSCAIDKHMSLYLQQIHCSVFSVHLLLIYILLINATLCLGHKVYSYSIVYSGVSFQYSHFV